ncbi:MAG: response regulator, partial [Cyanobacteria bacterium]|nr:response regulator [Cyanobacteriota bacterium]
MKPQPAEASRCEILIVDDTPDNLRLLSAILRNQGFEVRKALNGKRAIASIQAVSPDLILLDIRMPDMNGYEVCEYLKADPSTADIPVIFISALDDTLDKINAFAVGGVDYITKPFQEAEVLARIENQLRLRQLQQQLLQQNEELTRSNRELEQFAYVVSHDLQQPLQSITGFAKIMAMQSKNTLDDDNLGYLQSILDAGGRMQRLIQDLLLYAR